MDFDALAHQHDHWIHAPGFPLEPDFPREEYELRVTRARDRMALEGLDALVITSGLIGQWFTSALEPHEWHDRCQSRSAWYILSPTHDVLCMTPTAGGEHFNTTRRMTWVSEIRGIVERAKPPRVEIWALEQMPRVFADLGLLAGRLGFELGGGMTLGLAVNDFMRLRELMPDAKLIDGSPVIRWLMSVLTPWELENLRVACSAADWIHAQVPDLLRPGVTEHEFTDTLRDRFESRYGEPYSYDAATGWDVRNAHAPESSNLFHAVATSRPFTLGDVVMHAWSGVGFRRYRADTDRVWAIGTPSRQVLDLYRMTWESNRAMAEAIRPGVRCCDVFAAGAEVEARWRYPARGTGRTGHGYRNTGSLSIHPDNETVLEPGMVISVEPMFPTPHGFFDLEDQYVVTDSGAECLNEPAPERLPVIAA